MGCDVYIEWDEMTPDDERHQSECAGFITGGGKFGYLRGPQGFSMCRSAECGEWDQPSPSELREGIPRAVEASIEKYGCPNGRSEYVENLNDFCDLYERLHAEGRNPRVIGSW